jgi:elongation factor G
MHDVRGKDGVGATMDSMELEKERGITITSAATYCEWLDHEINIIDTPGHVDFTIEVERSLRVLDGAILVLCSVGGVQSQSITVDQQMKRYKIPCIAFINKCDRVGASPSRVIDQLSEKLGHHAVAMQIPMGLEADFKGVVDLVGMKSIYFDGISGEIVRIEEIPQDLLSEAEEKREQLIDAASMFSDELTEAILEEQEITEDLIIDAVRQGALKREMTPVFMGSAYKNQGVQPLLDAVTNFLPCPSDVVSMANSLTSVYIRVLFPKAIRLLMSAMGIRSKWGGSSACMPIKWKTSTPFRPVISEHFSVSIAPLVTPLFLEALICR